MRSNAEIGSVLQKMLPKAPESDFLVSPGDVKEVRSCLKVIFPMKPTNHFTNFSASTKQPFLAAVKT